MNIKELAAKLYNMALDMDGADYIETQEEETQEIENALTVLNDYAELNPQANKHFKTLLNCLEAIAETN